MSDWHIKRIDLDPDEPNAALKTGRKIHALNDDLRETVCGRDATALVPVRVEGRDGGFPNGSDQVCRVCAQNVTDHEH